LDHRPLNISRRVPGLHSGKQTTDENGKRAAGKTGHQGNQ